MSEDKTTAVMAHEMNIKFGEYNNMPEREMYIRISDRLMIDVKFEVVLDIFIAVKETREYLLSKLSEF